MTGRPRPPGWSDEDAIGADVWPPVLAIDPGGTETGVCLRAGAGHASALLAVTVGRHRHEDEADDQPAAAARYSARVIATARGLLSAAADRIAAAAETRGEPVPVVRIAVEAMVEPTGTVSTRPRPGRAGPRISTATAADTARAAVVLGAVVTAWPAVLVVPPRGHDDAGLDAYPAPLVGATPTGWPRGASKRSHQRAAWLAAGWAHLAGELVTAGALTLTPPPPVDDLDALVEAQRRRVAARARTGRADTARTPAPGNLAGWADAAAAIWTTALDARPVPTGEPAPADAARLVAAAETAWARLGPPPAETGAPPDPVDLAERLLGRHGRAAGWPDETTAAWQSWLRRTLADVRNSSSVDTP